MNKIEAIIRPEKLTGVKNTLAEIGLVGVNVAYVTGRGAQKGIIVAGSIAQSPSRGNRVR